MVPRVLRVGHREERLIPITACRSCGGASLFTFLELGDQPLANALLAEADLDAAEPRYPLDIVLCATCTLVQNTATIAPEILFREYPYFSSFSETMLRHAAEVAERLRRERALGPDSLVVEIASNDGYLLKSLVAAGIPVLGVEPARNIAKVAVERGVPTVAEFFGESLARELAARGKAADVVIANNVMAHVPDINDVVAGVKLLLARDGVFVMETPYVRDMVDKLEFDTLYHEHVFCHSLTALERLYRRHGLAAQDVAHLPIHGGTIQVSVTHAGLEGERPRVCAMLEDEARWGVGRTAFYADFGRRVDALKDDLVRTLRRLRGEGKRIAGYGAAAKGSTLLNYMGIGRDLLDYVVDISTYKQGKLMPGNHLPILPPARLLEDRPDYVLLLAWNLVDEVMPQQSVYREAGGRFIVPVPAVRIV